MPGIFNHEPEADSIGEMLLRALEERPGYTYGGILPVARKNDTGAYSAAIPGAVRGTLKGLLDLVQLRMTPDAMMALPMMTAPGVAPAGALAANAGMRAARSLPMDEASRMARATEQGFTMPAYHGRAGSGADFKEFKSGPMFFSSRGDKAASYRAGFYEGGNVMPVQLGLKNPKVVTSELLGSPYHERIIIQEALDEGHDGIIWRSPRHEEEVYITFEPSQARSRFAAFDPAKKDSADLLAGRVPVPIAAHPSDGRDPLGWY